MEFVDRQLTCMDCSQPFVFTAGEQEFYDRKGFKEEPKRCKNCRDARKTRKTGDFMSNAAGGGAGAGGRGNGNGNGHHGSPYGGGSHDNSDDNIGNRAPSSAPSQSRGPREVRDVGARGGGGGGRDRDRDRDREMFDATCAQCGVQTRVPFKPVAGRPVYCRDCYGKRN